MMNITKKTILILYFRYLNDRMISYEASFSVEPLMSSNIGGGFHWPIGTVLSIIKTNSLDHAGNYTCAPSTLISGERKKYLRFNCTVLVPKAAIKIPYTLH